jgi:hypothetical protein
MLYHSIIISHNITLTPIGSGKTGCLEIAIMQLLKQNLGPDAKGSESAANWISHNGSDLHGASQGFMR